MAVDHKASIIKRLGITLEQYVELVVMGTLVLPDRILTMERQYNHNTLTGSHFGDLFNKA